MSLLNFKSFLVEEVSNKTDGLIDVANLPLYYNNEGVEHAANVLGDVHNHLLGKKVSADISTPYHGNPYVVFGNKRGKFSASVVGGKINEESDEILNHLHKIMPREGGEYGGVIMHTKDKITKKNNMLHTNPAGVSYSVPTESAEGKKMKNSQLGLVIDRHIANGKEKPMTKKDREKFKDHPDVDNIDPSVRSNPLNYTPEEQHEFMSHFQNAHIQYTKMKPEALESVVPHAEHIDRHVKASRAIGQEPSAESYIHDLTTQQKTAMNKGSNLSTKDKKTQQYADAIQHAFENKKHIDGAIQLTNHLHNAKSVLLGVAAKNNPYMHSINGKAVEPAGIVHTDAQGNRIKLTRT